MRVGLFTECYRPIVNGVVASIDALRGGLEAAGHETVCVAPEFPRFEDRDPTVVRLPSLPLPTPTEYRLCVPLLGASERARIGRLSVIHTHSPFVTGWLGQRLARRRGIPHVFTYHTRIEHYVHYVPFDRSMTERAAVGLTRTYANAADAVVVPTPAMERRLRELGVSVPIAVIPSAVDGARFSAGRRDDAVRASLGCRFDERLVLFVSRLAVEKNLVLALRAFAALADPRIRMAVVGDGPERVRCERAAAELGIRDRVHFAGAVRRDDLPDVYASADVFVFPSVTETQGLVLAEALWAGVPIVAADSAASRDVLAGAGRVVPAEPPAFARAIEATLANPARNAKLLAPHAYTVGMQTRRIIALYESLVAARA